MTYQTLTLSLALVLPFDLPRAQENRRRDSLLSLTRVRPRQESVIVDVNTIMRGALLSEDGGSNCGERLVVEATDEDMWLCLKSTQLAVHVNI